MLSPSQIQNVSKFKCKISVFHSAVLSQLLNSHYANQQGRLFHRSNCSYFWNIWNISYDIISLQNMKENVCDIQFPSKFFYSKILGAGENQMTDSKITYLGIINSQSLPETLIIMPPCRNRKAESFNSS